MATTTAEICDSCGNSFIHDDYTKPFDTYQLEFSGENGKRMRVDLCRACMGKMILSLNLQESKSLHTQMLAGYHDMDIFKNPNVIETPQEVKLIESHNSRRTNSSDITTTESYSPSRHRSTTKRKRAVAMRSVEQ